MRAPLQVVLPRGIGPRLVGLLALGGAQGAIGRLLHSDVRASDAPKAVESLLRAWSTHRVDASESFQAFTARHDVETLKQLAEQM